MTLLSCFDLSIWKLLHVKVSSPKEKTIPPQFYGAERKRMSTRLLTQTCRRLDDNLYNWEHLHQQKVHIAYQFSVQKIEVPNVAAVALFPYHHMTMSKVPTTQQPCQLISSYHSTRSWGDGAIISVTAQWQRN